MREIFDNFPDEHKKMLEAAYHKREKHMKLVAESIKKIPPHDRLRKKKGARDQDEDQVENKESTIAGIYKIVEHNMLNGQQKEAENQALTAFFAGK